MSLKLRKDGQWVTVVGNGPAGPPGPVGPPGTIGPPGNDG